MLSELTLDQLRDLKAKLEKKIASNPNHSRLEQVELKDVIGWIETRTKEELEAVQKANPYI